MDQELYPIEVEGVWSRAYWEKILVKIAKKKEANDPNLSPPPERIDYHNPCPDGDAGSDLPDSSPSLSCHPSCSLAKKEPMTVSDRQEPSYFYRVWLKAAQEAESELMRVLPSIPGGRKNGEPLLDYIARIDRMREVRMKNLLTAVEELKKQGGTYPL